MFDVSLVCSTLLSSSYICALFVSSQVAKTCYPVSVQSLSGMEGAPVFGKNGHLIGILIRPLRQKNSGVEVQVCQRLLHFICVN